ncbi:MULTISPECIES: hypothetical protein [Bacteroides]|nr:MULTISPECIES: hypothetical protein [Bacteroides]
MGIPHLQDWYSICVQKAELIAVPLELTGYEKWKDGKSHYAVLPL